MSIAYAAKHAERVSHLIIYGGYARGFLFPGDLEKHKHRFELDRAIVREGWGSNQDVYRQWFTSHFIPGGTAEQIRWFNELERVSATPEEAERELGVLGAAPPEEPSEWPRHVCGSPRTLRERLEALAQALGLEELMIVTIVHDHRARLRSYELLARAFELRRC